MNNDIIFQILDWTWYHEEDEISDELKQKYVIRLFGRTQDKKTIYVKVNNFTPFFYIEIPNNWRDYMTSILMEEVKKKAFIRKTYDGTTTSRPAQGFKEAKILNDKHRFYGFTNFQKTKFIQLIFNDYDSMKAYEYVFRRKLFIPQIYKFAYKYKLYESNIEPLIRCMHIRNLDSVGFCKIDKDKYTMLNDELGKSPTCCDLNIETNWNNLDRYENDIILPFTIASFDIECTSGDGSFPQAVRDCDKIIQIGTTFSRFGETECYKQVIITLGTCSPINDVEVIECKDEKDVLLQWTKLIKTENPDIITGYNIFGFDFEYMKDRSLKLGIYNRFMKLSRINNEISEWKEKKLASSALGDNTLKYIEMTGRVLIDMYKLIQKDFKLPSYKLDSVAGNFIQETINKIEIDDVNNLTTIWSKGIYGVKPGHYITIMYNDGITDNKHMDGEKFKIMEIREKEKIIIVQGKIENDIMEHKYKVLWCNAKDDVSPKDIFEKQEGTSDDRALIAKYCVQDCALVSKLVAKIQVIANNISMAKVCHVPLSYLFFRGQGVKIFSLVARKCRLKKHLIPILPKPKKKEDEDIEKTKEKSKEDRDREKEQEDNEQWDKFIEKLTDRDIGKDGLEDDEEQNDDDDDGYEGATVFPPVKGVHFEPIPVCDYSSLYPSCMIYGNYSHEMWVNNSEFDNLPGYVYRTISYMSNKLVEKYSLAQSNIRKKELLQKYIEQSLDYRFENVLKKIDDTVYDITYVYDKNNIIHCEIAVSKNDFRVFKYDTAKFAEKEDGTKGIISEILQDLLSSRKIYKKKMEQEEDLFIKLIYECMQLAFKVTANSLYGQTGAPTSPIFLKQIAASTTATGRVMLQFAKHTIETEYAELIKLSLEKNKDKFMERANEIFAYHPNEIQTKDHGIINISTRIKIKIPESKFTKIGFKDRTDFFQQFYEGMNEHIKGYTVNPQIIYGDSVTSDTPILLKNEYGNIIIKTIDSINESNIWTFYEDDKYNDKEINNNISYKVWTENGWKKINKIIRHKTNKKMYEIITPYGYVKVTEDHSLLDKYNNRIKPTECNNKTELLYSFPDIYNNNGNTGFIGYKNISNNMMNASLTYLYLKQLYKNIIIIKTNIGFIFQYSNDDILYDTYKIQINEIPNIYDYVYDLETENGHYQAGVGELIVHNTDSVFFNPHLKNNETGEKVLDKKGLIMGIHLGIWSGKVINVLLPENMAIEYEKTLWPFAILTKKRYVGNLYEEDPDKFKQKSMGIVLKRRDNAPIVKIVCGGIIDEIINKRSATGAIDFTKKTIKDIFSGKYPIERFIITKTLKSNYADRTRIVHAVLADRMAERDPGNKPQSNDRLPYAYIEVEDDKKIKLQGDRVEHPDYILLNNLKLDYLFYITNQIMKPSIQFLELLVENPSEIFDEFIIREHNRRKGIKPINYYFNEQNKNNNDNEQNKNNNDNEQNKNNNDNDNEENEENEEKCDIIDINNDYIEYNNKSFKKKKTQNKKIFNKPLEKKNIDKFENIEEINKQDIFKLDGFVNIDEINIKQQKSIKKIKNKKIKNVKLDDPQMDENGFLCL
jgi:DNA polymerase elongation subunit (family B)